MNTENQVIRNRDGEPINFNDKKQLATAFLEEVVDSVTRSILFGTRIEGNDAEGLVDIVAGKIKSSPNLVAVMRRIINYVFVTALCRWKQLDDNISWGREADIEYFRNSRFTKLFRSAIAKEDITLDLQIFALMELWVSLKKTSDTVRGRFENIFTKTYPFDNIGLTLQDVRDTIKNASFKTVDAGKYTYEYCSKLCYRVLCSFPFLCVVKTTLPLYHEIKDKKDFRIVYALNVRERVTLYPNEFYDRVHFIVTDLQLQALIGEIDPDDEPIEKAQLYLMTEMATFNGNYQYTYRSFSTSGDEIRVEFEAETEEKPVRTGDASSTEVSEVRKFLAFSYKNIRELALAICDAIKEQPSVKDKIYKACKERGSRIIPTDIKQADSSEIYWDNVITLSLIEWGPSEFLELLFKDDKNDSMIKDIIENIGWRCIGNDEAEKLKDAYEKELNEIGVTCRLTKKARDEQVRALRVQKILEAMKFNQDKARGINPFEESLSYKYENIYVRIKMLQEEKDATKRGKIREELEEIYKNIFKFLQVFYVGMDGYAESIKKKKESKNTTEFAPGGEPPEMFAFSQCAKNKNLEIENQTLTQLFEGFCALCEEYNVIGLDTSLSDDEKRRRENKARNLKSLITRNYICDVKKLRYFVDIKLEDNTHSTIFEMLGDSAYKYEREKDYKEWLNYFIDLFFFLIYNNDYYKHGLYEHKEELIDKDCDPIYPYLVTYYRENVDRDNLKKCTYRVPVPTGGNDTDFNEQGFIVNILTEKEYRPMPYFCIPLKYGASENWWINPFLIPRGFVYRMEGLIKEGKAKQ